MTEAVIETKPNRLSRLRGWRDRLTQNPIILKELRSRMRGGRAFILLSIYLVLISVFMSLVYFGFSASSQSIGGPNTRQLLGKAIFYSITGMELMMVAFIAPGLTAGSIAAERERQTFDLLRTTLISSRSLVWGKLISALSYLILLLVAALPLESLAYMLGGVSIEELLIGLLLLVVTALFYSCLGIFYSSFMRRTLGSTVLAYATAILVVVGIPALLFVSMGFGSYLFSGSNPSTTSQISILLIGWLLISLNPIGTGVVTEVLLLSNQSLISYNLPLANGVNIFIISPWIIYSILYILLSLWLVVLSIYFVRKVE
jgi:ABC-type transport system involved in multi-copper enzyme maturation permease subunit